MAVPKLFKQSLQEQDEVKKQLDQAMLPSVLDWEKSIDMIGAHMRANYVDENGVFDVSFGNAWASIKALKDVLIWKVAPRKSSQSMITQDERSGKVIRDLRRERQERAEANRQQPVETLEQKHAKANRQGAINLMWASAERFIADYSSGKTHGTTARHKAALKEVYDVYRQRQNGNPAECLSALQNKAQALQSAPMFG